ncbi:MAG TPA: cation diffusion facilitator family transporter [Polyangiales bacterium]
MHEGSQKAVLAALAANLGIAAVKFVGFFFTGATSMLAEAVHSVADCGNQALLLVGGRRASRAPSDQHPFGYAMERYFWSFVVALVIFLLGGVFAIYEGVDKLWHPQPIESPLLAVGILLVGAALEGWSFRTALAEARKLRGRQSMLQFVRQTKAAELPVVLLEDLGALAGLSFALLGVGLSVVTHEPRFDALGSVAIGVLLVGIGFLLATEMRSLLVGESASDERIAEIRAALLADPKLKRVIHLRTLHLGPDDLLVAAKIELDDTLSFREVAQEIDAAEARVRAVVPIARLMFLEPDVFRPAA